MIASQYWTTQMQGSLALFNFTCEVVTVTAIKPEFC